MIYVRRDKDGYWSFDWPRARLKWSDRTCSNIYFLMNRWWG